MDVLEGEQCVRLRNTPEHHSLGRVQMIKYFTGAKRNVLVKEAPTSLRNSVVALPQDQDSSDAVAELGCMTLRRMAEHELDQWNPPGRDELSKAPDGIMIMQGKVGGTSFGLGGGKADLLLWKGLVDHSANRSTDGQPTSPPLNLYNKNK